MTFKESGSTGDGTDRCIPPWAGPEWSKAFLWTSLVFADAVQGSVVGEKQAQVFLAT